MILDMKDWTFYERECLDRGYKVVCGVDEAGRGPLAGPVCAAAVVLKNGEIIEGANDSKKLSEKRRELLFDVIKERAIAYSAAFSDEEEIEKLNILNATHLAMQRAVEGLSTKPDIVLIDGNTAPRDLQIPTMTIVGGDALSMSIACASIVAKVTRDRYMKELDVKYPIYEFGRHKGYGTKVHIQRIREFGVSPIHRRSFLRKILGQIS